MKGNAGAQLWIDEVPPSQHAHEQNVANRQHGPQRENVADQPRGRHFVTRNLAREEQAETHVCDLHAQKRQSDRIGVLAVHLGAKRAGDEGNHEKA